MKNTNKKLITQSKVIRALFTGTNINRDIPGSKKSIGFSIGFLS
jgi:hypothetical protein